MNSNEYHNKFIAIHRNTIEFIESRQDPGFVLFLEDFSSVFLSIRKQQCLFFVEFLFMNPQLLICLTKFLSLLTVT